MKMIARSLTNIIVRLFIVLGVVFAFIGTDIRTAAADDLPDVPDVPVLAEEATPPEVVPDEIAQEGFAPEPGTPQAEENVESIDDDVALDRIPHSAVGTWKALSVLAPGTAVVHDFDVVVANIYPSGEIPDTEPAMVISETYIDSMLTDAASWWSANTKLGFDFNQNTRYTAINTTCDTIQQDSMAAYGYPFDSSVYTSTGRNLLIFNSDTSCGDYQGLAYTVASTGNVFEGGIFGVVLGWAGMIVTDHTDEESYAMRTMSLAHEFGHTIGLMHTNTVQCSSGANGDDKVGLSWDGHYLTNCPVYAYGDKQTVMGNAVALEGLGLNVLQRRYLSVGWDDNIVDQPGTTTVTISRNDKSPEMPKGAVVPLAGSSSSLLDLGIDYNDGVYLTTGYSGAPLETNLLIPPQSSVFAVPDIVPLAVGQTYVTADGSVSVRTVSDNWPNAEVEITLLASGVDSEVWISRDDSVLTAQTTAPSTATVTYQWFRNGQPVADATDRRYTPPVPDPNAVFRVEATFTDGQSGPTVRYSRGILVDDQRLVVNDSTATISAFNENGMPVAACNFSGGRHQMLVTVYSLSGELMTEIIVIPFTDWTIPGGNTCTFTIPLTLTGSFTVRVETQEISILKPYWEPLTAELNIGSTAASARLFLATGGAPNSWDPYDGLPAWMLYAGVPLLAYVSVTNDDGSPAVGVPVELSAPDNVVVTPSHPVTDSSGLAYAELTWDPTIPPPKQWTVMSVEATVPGLIVESSPASFHSYGDDGHMFGWYEGDTTAKADGGDPVILHVRMWDDNNELITGDSDQFECVFIRSTPLVAVPHCTVTWDPQAQDYVTVVTSEYEAQGKMWVILHDPFRLIAMPQQVVFEATPISLYAMHDTVAASQNGVCNDGTPAVSTLSMVPVGPDGQVVHMDSVGMEFSVPDGSPLEFVSDPVVAQAGYGTYDVNVTSRLAGTFEVVGTLTDGSMRKSYWMTFVNASFDPAQSTVTMSAGPKVADGIDAYTVTANLVSRCNVPIDTDAELGKRLTLDVTNAVYGVDTGVSLTKFVQDHEQPGTYTGTVASIIPGTYYATVTWYDYTEADEATVVNPDPLAMEFIPASTSTVSGILTLDPAELTSGSTIATALVADSQGEPVAGVEVTFGITGRARFANGETMTTLTTDAAGQAVVLVTATSDGCDDEGFDVSAIMAISDLPLVGSPVHGMVLPEPGICGPTLTVIAVPTEGTVVYANGEDSWTGYFIVQSHDGTPVTGGADGFHSITVTNEMGELAYWVEATNVTETGSGMYAVEFTTTIPGTYQVTAMWEDSGTEEAASMTFAAIPDPPVVLEANAHHVYGTAVPGEIVQVDDETDFFWDTALTREDRFWEVLTPEGVPSQQITVSVVSELGFALAQTTVWLDTDAPEPPRVDVANMVEVTGDVGAVEPFATVFVTFPNGAVLSTTAAENGSYSILTPSDMVSGTVSATQVDTAGNESTPTVVELAVALPLTATAQSAQVYPGDTQVIVGENFQPGEHVCLTLGSANTILTEGNADATGRVSLSFVVPSNTAIGVTDVTLAGSQSGSVTITFEVLAAPATQCWYVTFVKAILKLWFWWL